MLPVIIGSGVVSLILLITLIVKVKKRKNREQEIQNRAKDKMREEALDRIILNEKAEINDLRAGSEKPFEVHYDTGVAKKEDEKRFMLRIEEKSELSVRQYMLDPSNDISIGSAKDNSIVISRIENKHCIIGKQGKALYLKNLGKPDSVNVVRKRKRISVDSRKLELLNGDEVHIGDVTLKLIFIQVNE